MRRRSPNVLVTAAACAALVALAACGNDSNSATAATDAAVATTPATTTSAPSTTSSSTTTSTTSTSTTSTTSTTTVPVTLPNPEDPPADPNAAVSIVAVGTIEIPKIGVTKTMYEGISLTTLNHGPGHWPGTAMPGHQGNVVIAGHRVSHDKPFRNIDQLVPGDQVILTTDEGRFVYQVTGTDIVYPDALWIIDQSTDYTATLFACHPAGSTRQRIVVHLVYVPNA
jgi:sortase A